MGDFNAQAESEEINVLMESGMKDAYRELNPDAEGFTWNPQQNSNIRTHYFSKTVGEDNGLFAAIDEIAQVATGRIDFIFVGPAAMWQKEIKPNHCSVVMDKLIDGMHTSDHFGILAEIQFVPGGYPWLK